MACIWVPLDWCEVKGDSSRRAALPVCEFREEPEGGGLSGRCNVFLEETVVVKLLKDLFLGVSSIEVGVGL